MASNPGTFPIQRGMVKSRAFLALTGKSSHVLLLFLESRKMAKNPFSGKRREPYIMVDGGEGPFTYTQARERGISQGQFTRAISQLVAHGFLDIVYRGGGMMGDASIYKPSKRWRRFGKPDFVQAERKPDERHIGYQDPAKRGSGRRKATRTNARGPTRMDARGPHEPRASMRAVDPEADPAEGVVGEDDATD